MKKNNIGYRTPFKIVPIVPSAVLYDFGVLDINPKLEDGYMGATVGKWAGLQRFNYMLY